MLPLKNVALKGLTAVWTIFCGYGVYSVNLMLYQNKLKIKSMWKSILVFNLNRFTLHDFSDWLAAEASANQTESMLEILLN